MYVARPSPRASMNITDIAAAMSFLSRLRTKRMPSALYNDPSPGISPSRPTFLNQLSIPGIFSPIIFRCISRIPMQVPRRTKYDVVWMPSTHINRHADRFEIMCTAFLALSSILLIALFCRKTIASAIAYPRPAMAMPSPRSSQQFCPPDT